MTRLLLVHYAGDYREADRVRRETGGETYYGHGYILDQLAAWRESVGPDGEAGFLCATAPEYWETLDSGVTVIGAGADPDREPARVIRLIERFAPTHLVVFGPLLPMIRWGLTQRVRLAVVLADSFVNPWHRWVRFRRLPALLRDPGVSLAANHGINAARALVAIGVDAAKVIPWDFPHRQTPEQSPLKTHPGAPPHTLLYVGTIGRKKGVGDLLRAAALLMDRIDVQVMIVGTGAIARFAAMAARLGIADRVTFTGQVPNGDVAAMMTRANLVVVPSRHAFPEGLPLTLYEALASRTPVVASDHPMFAGHLVDGESAAVFRAGRPRALADAIAAVLTDPALYRRLSEGGAAAWHRMQQPVKWGEMLTRWMRDDASDRAWLAAHTVAAVDCELAR